MRIRKERVAEEQTRRESQRGETEDERARSNDKESVGTKERLKEQRGREDFGCLG